MEESIDTPDYSDKEEIEDFLWDQYVLLEAKVGIAISYNNHRFKHFRFWSRLIKFINILMASSVIITIYENSDNSVYIAIALALLNAGDVTFDFEGKCRFYEQLRGRWYDLGSKVNVLSKNITNEYIKDLLDERDKLYEQSVGGLVVLTEQSHYEYLMKIGKLDDDNCPIIKPIQKLFMNYFDLFPSLIKSRKDLEKKEILRQVSKSEKTRP